jgi:hypothetical protein
MQAHYAACRCFVIRRYTDCYRNEQIASLRARRKHAPAGFRVRVFEARLRCRFDGMAYRGAKKGPPTRVASYFWPLNSKVEIREICDPKSKGPVTALSLTTPAVSRDFIPGFSAQAHTSSMAREPRVCDRIVFPSRHPNRSAHVRFIDSVLPTKHLFGHDRP